MNAHIQTGLYFEQFVLVEKCLLLNTTVVYLMRSQLSPVEELSWLGTRGWFSILSCFDALETENGNVYMDTR